ncbi:MAG: ABC transporter permease [Candidatus Promineifilaceae bacterium]
MIRYLAQKIVLFLLTLQLLSVIVFWIAEIAPGNIAYNKLGVFITPEQEASFNNQYALDDPSLTRYRRWLLGSDYQASRLLGTSLTKRSDSMGQTGWWSVADDGTLYRPFVNDGKTIVRRELQPDGTVIATQHPDDQWELNEAGVSVFWGIYDDNRAAMWIEGGSQTSLYFNGSMWITERNTPIDYLPLQKGMLRFDPGISINDNRPVAEMLGRRLGNSALLAGVSFVLIMPISFFLGVVAALNKGNFIDRTLSFFGIVTTMTPQFVSGVLLIMILGVWLRWVPPVTVIASGESLFSQPELLILPILTLTLAELGYILRLTRASMLDVLGENYIRTAELKGLPRHRVIFKHALKNALLAPITVMMLHVNYLIGGLVIVEQIFGFPGLGRYLLNAIFTKDVVAIEAGTLLLLIIATATQLVSEVIYVYLNPKIRFV